MTMNMLFIFVFVLIKVGGEYVWDGEKWKWQSSKENITTPKSAMNAAGSDNTSINLMIQEVPETPSELKVLGKTGRYVSLTWKAPYDGNSAITRYLIEYKPTKGNWQDDIDRVLVLGTENQAGVYSLRPDTSYHFRIVANNVIGYSGPSNEIQVDTSEEKPSGPPIDVRLSAVDQHTLRVQWKLPLKDEWNGKILGHYVGYKKSNNGDDKPYTFETIELVNGKGTEHSLTISNLEVWTEYIIIVQSFNKIGDGPMSEEITQFTSEGGTSMSPQNDTRGTRIERWRASVQQRNIDQIPLDIEELLTREKNTPDIVTQTPKCKDPDATKFLSASVGSVTLHLDTWKDGGCDISYFKLEYKEINRKEWTLVSRSIFPVGNFVVLDLDPATWYNLRVDGRRAYPSSPVDYKFATLTTKGDPAPPLADKTVTPTSANQVEAPGVNDLLDISAGSVTLYLDSWQVPNIVNFKIEYRLWYEKEWTVSSNSVQSGGGNYVILDLNPATFYSVKVTAVNNDGVVSSAEYDFATLTKDGAKVEQDSGRPPIKMMLQASLQLLDSVLKRL